MTPSDANRPGPDDVTVRESVATDDATVRVTPAHGPPVVAALRTDVTAMEDRDEIGRGGMSTVRRVFDPHLKREIAVKVLHPTLVGPEAQRFVEEAQLTSQLEHPNIAPVHALGVTADGRPCFSMRLVGGETLDAMITDAGEERLAPERLTALLKVIVKVCDAVSFAHDRGVVHRDIKPANIMIGAFGRVYLMDWGVARRLVPGDGSGAGSHAEDPRGAIIGTPSFMPPEQAHARHEDVDTRSDVFALGGVLYRVLYGRSPYHSDSLAELVALAQAAEPPPFETRVGPRPVPPELIRIAGKAMAADAGARFPSVAAFQKEIEDFMQSVWHLPEQRYAAGATVLVEGEPGDTAYIIAEGRCVAFTTKGGKRHELCEMTEGDVFGEIAVLDEKPRSASVEAMTDCTLMVVSRDVLAERLGLDHWFGAFVSALVKRFREADARLREGGAGDRR